MEWELSMQHAVSGYLPLMPMLPLYFTVLSRKGKKQTPARIILCFAFCFYLVGILAMTGIWWIDPLSPVIVWVPFADMARGSIGTALNAMLFIPLGLFLPMLYRKFDNIGRVALAGFLISLSVEVVQMFGCGTTDINDLMTNTAGSCLGYCISVLLCRALPKSWRETFQIEGAQCYREPLFYWALSLLIMTTVQSSIFDLLF